MSFRLSLIASAAAAIVFASAAQAQEILVYNAQHESLTRLWLAAFTKETGIRATMRQGSDTDMGNQIIAEGAASPADVFLTENSPAMVIVDNAKLFAPVDAATMNQVPAQYRSASGNWVGIAARATVLAYNKTKIQVSALPKSMTDLADPAWKGRWAASPSGADFQAIVGAYLELKGETATAAWLKGMKANSRSYRGNPTVLRAVNAGEVETGLIYHYYYYTDQERTGQNSNNSGMHFFKNKDPGAFISISGGGVLASSKNKAQAQAFLKWLTTKNGQDILRTAMEYAVATGVESHPKLPSLSSLDAPTIDTSKLNHKKVSEMMTAAGLL